MEALVLFISLAALIYAGLAYKKSGGSLDKLKPRVEDLGRMTDALKTRIADILENAEKNSGPREKSRMTSPGQEAIRFRAPTVPVNGRGLKGRHFEQLRV